MPDLFYVLIINVPVSIGLFQQLIKDLINISIQYNSNTCKYYKLNNWSYDYYHHTKSSILEKSGFSELV